MKRERKNDRVTSSHVLSLVVHMPTSSTSRASGYHMTISGGSDGSGDVSIKEVKRKQYNLGNKKVTDDRPLKKLKQVVEYDEDLYDSDDLEVFNIFIIHTFRKLAQYIQMLAVVVRDIGSVEWELYFRHEDRVGGRIIFFPNHENNVIANINSKLTPSQVKLFRETCFGYFLDMNPIARQTQLIHSALHREVHQKNPSKMWFKFGSQNFRFSLAEFAVVTGLLCVGDSDMSAYAKKENAFVDKYFSDQQVTVSVVEERFRYNDFKLDEYAVKMAVLYFVSNCLFTIPNSKKDLVIKDVNDVGLVTENVKDYPIDPILNIAEGGGVLGEGLQDAGDGDLVNEGDRLQDVGDGCLVNEGHAALQTCNTIKEIHIFKSNIFVFKALFLFSQYHLCTKECRHSSNVAPGNSLTNLRVAFTDSAILVHFSYPASLAKKSLILASILSKSCMHFSNSSIVIPHISHLCANDDDGRL
ncbi:hypothetical protein G4B88_026141 [Cannabis sativa]|uniref:DUF1985 domain-containing protein n=1 Tax=Cannabis sativa TaxID=3483 RepID=A0A7J6HA81_CANSA|nr:hypothetical protein G4B88_026141 [Cannabis sativa]